MPSCEMPDGDVEEIGAGITELLKDENVSRQMAEWGPQMVLDEFTWETVASRRRDVLVIGRRRPWQWASSVICVLCVVRFFFFISTGG